MANGDKFKKIDMKKDKKISDSPKNYIYRMFLKDRWARYVMEKEKEEVIKIWKLDNFMSNEKEVILDLGMGPGRWSRLFTELKFRKVVGLDIDKRMVHLAKNGVNKKNFMTVHSDMQDLPFKQREFDKVFTYRAIKYVNDISVSLSEIYRVLKNGGSAFIEFSNNSVLIRFLDFLFRKFNVKERSKLGRYIKNSSFYSVKDIKKEVKRAKLKVVEIRPSFILPATPLPFLSKIYPPVWISLDKALSKILSQKLFSRSWLVLVEKT